MVGLILLKIFCLYTIDNFVINCYICYKKCNKYIQNMCRILLNKPHQQHSNDFIKIILNYLLQHCYILNKKINQIHFFHVNNINVKHIGVNK